jgi:adenylate cyclase
LSAHDFFLKGRELMFGSKRDRDIFEQFMSCFRRAIELDPNYASAYAGLGMGYSFDYLRGYNRHSNFRASLPF